MTEKRKDVVFRRIRGRIVPIRRKKGSEDLKAAAKFGLVGATAFGSASLASKQLKRSNIFFNKSALLRGTRTLSTPGSSTSRKLAASAGKAARFGGKSLGKAKLLTFGGALLSSIFAVSATGDILETRFSEGTKEAAQTAASIAAGLGTVALFGKKAGLRGFRSSIRESIKSGSTDEQIGVLFGRFAQGGRLKTRKLIEKMAATARRRKKKKEGVQLDLFLKKF